MSARLLLACCVALLACSSKKQQEAKPAPTAPSVQDAQPRRALGPTRAAVDCASLLTIDDVKAVCGARIRQLAPASTERAGRNCNRAGGSYNARLLFMLAIGTGDVGHQATPAKTHKQHVGQEHWHTVMINKRPFDLHLRTSHHDGKKPPCTPEQLDALARRVAGRLP